MLQQFLAEQQFSTSVCVVGQPHSDVTLQEVTAPVCCLFPKNFKLSIKL